MFKPGDKKPPNSGRKKGQTNKVTKTVKDTVFSVFEELQNDPKHDLLAFAKRYPRDFYNIAAKLIPTEVQAKVTGTINHFTIEPDAGCEPIQD